MTVEQTIQRCVLRVVILFLRIGNVIDSFLNIFGIKLCKINRETIFKGRCVILNFSMKKSILINHGLLMPN